MSNQTAFQDIHDEFNSSRSSLMLSPHLGRHPATGLVFLCIQRSLVPCHHIHCPFTSIVACNVMCDTSSPYPPQNTLHAIHSLFRRFCVNVHYQITGFNEHKDMRVCELGPRMWLSLGIDTTTPCHRPRCACLIDHWLHFRGVSLHQFLPSYTALVGVKIIWDLSYLTAQGEGDSLRPYHTICVVSREPSSFLDFQFRSRTYPLLAFSPGLYWSVAYSPGISAWIFAASMALIITC